MDEPGSAVIQVLNVLTRKQIYDRIQAQNASSFNERVDTFENLLISFDKFDEDQVNVIKRKYTYVKFQMKKRWKNAHFMEERFLSKNSEWLQGTFEMPKLHSSAGRPSKCFEESSERSKRRKTEALREVDLNTLAYATSSKLYSEGKRDASLLLKDFESSPKRANRYKKAYTKTEEAYKLTPLDALKMIVEADLTRRQYEVIRATNKNIYPCYSLIQKVKQDCYPEKHAYRITETCAELDLAALLRLTNARLIESLIEVFKTIPEGERLDLTLLSKWGCDGSQQAQYRQKFASQDDSDKYIFQSCMVPLRIISNTTKKVIWENPTPSSPRFCRPIRIRFVKESVDITKEEIAYVNNSIKNMPEYLEITLQNMQFKIKQNLVFTMVDGKVCNSATNNKSTLRCYLCNETSSEFNKLKPEKIVNENALSFGLSILHARIRFFESLLHLSYKLPIQKGRLYKKNKEDSEVFEKTKKEIQDNFKLELGLLVDIPKAGFGNTNDGNTSRRFFEDVDKASEITGIDKGLIYRLKVILEAISSGIEINTARFEEYANEAAKLYVELYGWCPMTPTLHKVLRHGATIIKKALLPIGQLSEEAAEARNKHFKLYRENFARKFSREDCNLDVINRLLLTSDPVISMSRPKRIKRSKPFLPETIALFEAFQSETEDSEIEEISFEF